jgi:aminotransferase in exopolysaccharide biosynthesis
MGSLQHVMDVSEQLLGVLDEVAGTPPVSLHEPIFIGREQEYLNECLSSTFVSSVGPFVTAFERKITEITGATHAVATVNGTSALQLALLVAGVQPNDEVLLPSLTFAATANAVAYCNAIPHFVDSTLTTFGVDPQAMRRWLGEVAIERGGVTTNRTTGRAIRAILPVHIFGHPCDMPSILDVAKEFKLVVVEDAAESLGSWLGGRHAGTFGDLGILSFNGNKIITTGGGGMVLTDRSDFALRLRHLSTTAKTPHAWEFRHDEVGFNFRMPNINAALGLAQLEGLDLRLSAKRDLFYRYKSALGDSERLSLVNEPDGATSNYWLNAVRLDRSVRGEMQDTLNKTNDAGFGTRPLWSLLHQSKPFRDCPSAPLPQALEAQATIINLPSGPGLVLSNPNGDEQ